MIISKKKKKLIVFQTEVLGTGESWEVVFGYEKMIELVGIGFA